MALTKNAILASKSVDQIYHHYCPSYEPSLADSKKNVISVFSPKEKNPSLAFYKGSNDCILYKCFSSGNQGDVFQFVADLKGLDCKTEFRKVLEAINKDLRLGLDDSPTYNDDRWKAEYYKDFTNEALAFWSLSLIFEDTLLKYRVRQLRILTYNKKNKFNYEKSGLIAFEFSCNGRKKLYVPAQPNRPDDNKYIAKTTTKVDIFGLDQLPRWRVTCLLILEGESDVLTAAAHGFYAVSFQSASTRPTRKQIRELKKRASNLVLCYDNDQPGQDGAKFIVNNYNLPHLTLPDSYNDVRDFVPGNRDTFESLIEQALIDHREKNKLKLWEYDYSYWTSRKGEIVQVSNFILQVEAMIKTNDKPIRLVKLINKKGSTGLIPCDSSVFKSETSFADFCRNQMGFYVFSGTKKDLSEIELKEFELCDYMTEIDYQGYSSTKDCFYFGDRFFDFRNDKFCVPNESGVYDDIYLKAADCNSDIEGHVIVYQKGRLTPSLYFESLVDSFGSDRAVVATAFAVASLHFEFISKKFRFFPMLGIEGQKGTGKGSLVKMLLSLWCPNIQETGLSNATPIFITRRLAQRPSVPVWLDEYKISLASKMQEAIKNFYDLIGRSKAQYTNGNETTRSPILSPVIITGEEAPKNNEALYSRFISLVMRPFDSSNKTALVEHRKRETLFSDGGNDLLIQLYKKSHLIQDKFDETYDNLLDIFFNYLVDQDVQPEGRVVKNYAIIATPFYLLREMFGINSGQFLDGFFAALVSHSQSLNVVDDVNLFWSHLVEMSQLLSKDPHYVREGWDYLIEGGSLYVRSRAIALYSKYYRTLYNYESKAPSSIETYLTQKKYFVSRTKKYFTSPTGNKTQLRCLEFSISTLPSICNPLFSLSAE